MRSLLMLALVAALACAQPHIPAEIEVPPTTVAAPDWEALFATPRAIEVVPLLTGEINVDRSILLNLDDPRLEDQEDRKMWVPVLAYLVRHQEYGDLLIDAGFDSSFAQSSHGNFGGVTRFVEIARQPDGNDTASLIRSAGGDPSALRMIILSHLHLDHTAGLPELPKSVPLYGGPLATQGYETLWYAPTHHLAGFDAIHTLSFDGLPGTGPGRAIDLFGDASFFAVSAPGHVPGNLSFVINGAKGPVLLTCDALHLRLGFKDGIAPGFAKDRAAANATLARQRAFAEAHPQLRVFVGHDASDWDMTRGAQPPL